MSFPNVNPSRFTRQAITPFTFVRSLKSHQPDCRHERYDRQIEHELVASEMNWLFKLNLEQGWDTYFLYRAPSPEDDAYESQSGQRRSTN
jgi:hypothetical protein